jgi:GNAT superfamily N-acetyltransferase
MGLKEAAGWNQTEEDWRTLLSLAPDSCFGFECDGQLAATTTAVLYGKDLAWIGMVLTAPEFRRRGFAHTLMEHTLRYLRERGVAWAKLDATEMGAPVYSDFGFRVEGPVERWQRATSDPLATEDCIGGKIDLQAMTHQDRFGVSREPLLEQLIRAGGAYSNESGFALWRPGSLAHYFGPCVATSVKAAEQLLLCCLHGNSRLPFTWDLAPQNARAVQLAEKYSFQRVRKLSRMAHALRADAKPVQPDMNSIFALAGFEFG